MNENYRGLHLSVQVRAVSSRGRRETTLYVISGLPPEDSCVVGCAGVGLNGKKRWYVRWDRLGCQLDLPEVAYASPGDALKAIKALKAKGL